MTICFVTREFPPETAWGGIATYHFDLTQALVAAGHTVHVIALSKKEMPYTTKKENFTVHRIVPSWQRLGKYPVLWRLLKYYDGYHFSVNAVLKNILAQEEISIIETPNLHGETAIFQLFNRKVPVVVRLHSCLRKNLQMNQLPYRIALRISGFFERIAVKKAHAISAVSQSIIRYNGYLPLKDKYIQVIGNPIDVEKFNEERAIDKNLLLYVGRLDMGKGAHILAQALPLVLKRFPEVLCVFIGKNGMHANAVDMISWIQAFLGSNIKSVRFIDHIDRKELLPYYSGANMVVFPTLYESFGYIATESMASKSVVVASNIDGPAEIISHNINGVLFQAESPEDLAEKIIEVLSNPERMEQIRENAFHHVKATYSSDVIAEKMVEFYTKVIEKNE